MRGDIRGAAVPGSSPGSPHAVDRGDIATGGGADGEGELVPPPLSPTLHSPCFSLPALLRGIPIHFCRQSPPHLRLRQADTRIPRRHPPPRPRLRRSSPAPFRGAGSVRGDTWWAAVSGVEPVGRRAWFFSGLFPDTGPCGYHHGGWGRRGGGTCSPSPVSNAPELCTSHRSSPPAFLRGIPHTSAGSPHPARACGAPPPPPEGGRGSACDIRGAAVSGV